MSAVFKREYKFAEKAQLLLEQYLLGGRSGGYIAPAAKVGSTSDGSYLFGKTMLFNLACRLQKGNGGGDPMMQNIGHDLKHLPNQIHRQFQCFLMDICGPNMSLYGIVNTSDSEAICEPLAAFSLLFVDNPQERPFGGSRLRFVEDST